MRSEHLAIHQPLTAPPSTLSPSLLIDQTKYVRNLQERVVPVPSSVVANDSCYLLRDLLGANSLVDVSEPQAGQLGKLFQCRVQRGDICLCRVEGRVQNKDDDDGSELEAFK